MRRIALVITTTLTLLAAGTALAPPAAANTTIGWVLDANGSVHCYVAAGTNNHVICDTYWPGSPPTIRGAARINDWLPYACLGGAYMIAGNNAGTPAQLVYQNAPGYYCGRIPNGPLAFKAGTCWNGAAWNEGSYTNSPGLPYRAQGGDIYPLNSGGTNFPQPWGSYPVTCNMVGYSRAGHIIYH